MAVRHGGGAHHGTDGNNGRISEGGAWLIRPLFFCPSGGRTSAGMAVTQTRDLGVALTPEQTGEALVAHLQRQLEQS